MKIRASRIGILVLFAIVAAGESAALAVGEEFFRDTLDLSGVWQQVSTRNASLSQPASGWAVAQVPGTLWGTAQGGAAFTWFRRDITVPTSWDGRRIYLHLSGARFHLHVFLDGQLIAERLDGWTPFEVELRQAQPGHTHALAIRCQDWSATFKPGYVLPEVVTGDLRYEPRDQLMAPIGGHFGYYGIWDAVRLEARPQVWLDDVAIVPSVRNGVLSASGRISDPDADMWVEADVVDGDLTVLQIPPNAVKNSVWSLQAVFPDAHYWSPEDPKLYRLRFTLRRGAQGTRADVLEVKFGFRELWAEGPDLYLNGVKRHLRATSTWPSSGPQTREEVRAALATIKAGNNIAFRLHTQPWQEIWLEEADEAGLLIVEEGALWCDGGAYAFGDTRFWSNVRDHEAGMVRRDRNHASLVMWSIENEILHCGAASWDPNVEQNLAEVGRFVKQLDPGHLITFEADLDPGGVTDVIGLHYPHEMPDFTDYPNTADWLSGSTTTGTGGASFNWDRRKPLYIGEYLWIPYSDYSPGTVFFGDEAYLDREAYKLKAKAESWRHQTLGYRRAGVSGFCPWTSIETGGRLDPASKLLYDVQKEVYEPVAAFLREQDSRFFAGEQITRTFDVFNDSTIPRALDLRWSLEGAGNGSERIELDAAAYRALEVKISLPASAGEWNLSWMLVQDGMPMHSGWVQIRTYPRRVLHAPAFSPWTHGPISWGRPPRVFRTMVYDPKGEWSAKLRPEGLPFTILPDLNQLINRDPATDILVIGPGAFVVLKPPGLLPLVGASIPGSRAIADYLRRGGHVLILEQETLEGFPLPVSLVEHASTMTFPVAQHPLLHHLDADELKFWRGDHYVSRKEILRPTSSGGRAAVVSGGPDSIDQAAIVEFPFATGTVLLVQALVGEKLFSEPAARILFQSALDYLATLSMQASFRAAATVLVTESDDFRKQLASLGVAYRDVRQPLGAGDLSDARVVLMHGGGSPIVGSAPALADFLEKGPSRRVVYWHAPDAGAFDALKQQLGVGDLQMTSSYGPVVARPREDPLFKGMLREDLAFGGKADEDPNWVRSFVPDPAVIDRAFLPETPAGESLRVEAEQMVLEGLYVGVQGSQVAFYTGGSASFDTTVDKPGLYSLAVQAGGTPAAAVGPIVSIRVNGQETAQLTIAAQEMLSYGALISLPAGPARISIVFINDAVIGTEDRNLFLDAVLLGRQPMVLSDIALLTLPPAVIASHRMNGELVLDGVRWDNNLQNQVKAGRYASTLLAGLGASFVPPGPSPSWVEAPYFELVGESPYFENTGGELAFATNGTARATFLCVKSGTYDLLLRGRSTAVQGKYGIAQVYVDGRDAGEVEVNSGGTATFALGRMVDLSEGEHMVSVAFINDYYAPPEDRNLYVSAVGFRIR